MTGTRIVVAAMAVVMLAGAKDDPLAGRVAGAPVACIPTIDARVQAEIVDAKTITYSRTANRTWVVHPQGACPGLARFRTLIVEQRGGQLCQGDFFRTIKAPATVPSGRCTFGAFTPYDKAPAR